MVVLSLPTSVENFEGYISHSVVVGPSETLVFVSPMGREQRKSQIDFHLQSLGPPLSTIQSSASVNIGDAYIAKLNGVLARVVVVNKQADDIFQVYMVDEGMKSEVAYDELYELPEKMDELGVFACICPVFMPSIDKPSLYDDFAGRKCRCVVVDVGGSNVVIGYVKGSLLVDVDGVFTDLAGVISDKSDAQLTSRTDSTSESGQDSVFERDISTPSVEVSSPLTVGLTTKPLKAQAGGMGSDGLSQGDQTRTRERNSRNFGNREMQQSQDTTRVDRHAKSGALFLQTAFKEYKPGRVPTKLHVRFEKRDRSFKTFWVVNPSTFSAVEQALVNNAQSFAHLPCLRREGNEMLLKSVPCVVFTRADSSHTTFFRGVAAHFDRKTTRFSIFLVDFGWFKWVLAKDVIDISSMDKKNALLDLPVSLIHCREDNASALHAKELMKGNDYEMTVKSGGSANIFNVVIGDVRALPGPSSVQRESDVKDVNGCIDSDPLEVCKKIVNETCHQQLMTSLMLETLTMSQGMDNVQPSWQNLCMNTGAMRMMQMNGRSMAMPVAMPFFVPVPTTNNAMPSVCNTASNNTGTTEYDSFNTTKPPNTDWAQRTRGENTNWGQSRGNAQSEDRRDYSRDGEAASGHAWGGRKSRADVWPADRKQCAHMGSAPKENSSDMPHWLNVGKRRGGRRDEGKEHASGSRMTAWEMAVAEDRASRKFAAGDADGRAETK